MKCVECMNDMNNVDKCKISNICKNSMSLSAIESPQIRSIFTKLRIDSTWDSKVRSFKYKNVQSNQCTYCKSTQDIEHILLHCNNPDMISNRNTFFRKYIQYSYKFMEKGNTGKTREILNLNPSCTPDNTGKTKESICIY